MIPLCVASPARCARISHPAPNDASRLSRLMSWSGRSGVSTMSSTTVRLLHGVAGDATVPRQATEKAAGFPRPSVCGRCPDR